MFTSVSYPYYQISYEKAGIFQPTLWIVSNKLSEEPLLIDPTFIQFTEQKNRKLTGYAEWPGNKLSPILVSQLLDTGVIEMTEEIFNEYLNSFLQEKTYFSLEKYLIQNSVRMR